MDKFAEFGRNDWTEFARTMMNSLQNSDRSGEIPLEARALLDQIGAARSESLRSLESGAAMLQEKGRIYGRFTAPTVDRQGLVFYGQFLRLITGIHDGRTKACPHVNLASPRPMHGMACCDWLMCQDCIANPATRPVLNLSPIEEHTCDICRTYMGSKGCIHPTVSPISAVSITAGLCHSCLPDGGAQCPYPAR